uniref:Uncharacterized protein n=1 Tax=Oryza brachyantha TaxID=4533 RepID=J3MPC0_ORYBR
MAMVAHHQMRETRALPYSERLIMDGHCCAGSPNTYLSYNKLHVPTPGFALPPRPLPRHGFDFLKFFLHLTSHPWSPRGNRGFGYKNRAQVVTAVFAAYHAVTAANRAAYMGI